MLAVCSLRSSVASLIRVMRHLRCARSIPIQSTFCFGSGVTPGLGARELIRIAVGMFPTREYFSCRVILTNTHSAVKILEVFNS